MRNTLKFLSTIWLLMALVTAPLQVLNAAPQQADSGPCRMHIDNPDLSGADCPQCADTACTADGCTDSGSCATVHVQPAAFSGFHLATPAGTDSHVPARVYNVSFSAAPPLLRPPL